MIEILKKSIKMMNSNLKGILTFSTIITIASFGSSFFLPVCGVALSTMISFYMQQVFIKTTKTNSFDIEDMPEPDYKGILKCYGVSLIISILIATVLLIATPLIFVGTIKVSILNLVNLNVTNTLRSMMAFILFSTIAIAILVSAISLITPFATFTLLDEDFSENGFLKNISFSFKLAKGYRCKFFVAMMINYLLTLLSIFTLGLSLLYTYPLYLILISYIYNDSKSNFCKKNDI